MLKDITKNPRIWTLALGVMLVLLFSFIIINKEHVLKAAPNSVSYWAFEEPSGNSVLDVAGSNNGTLVNGSARITTGKVGKGIRFDGINDHFSVPDSASLESQSFSISAWVKRTGAQGDWAKILTKGRTDIAPWASYKLEFSGSSDTIVNWHIGFTDGSAFVVQNVTPIPDGQWTHLVGTYNGSQMKLYMNGVLQGTTDVSKTVKFDNIPLTIGGYNGWGYFKGDVDEINYYNYALSDTEAQQSYNEVPNITVTVPNTALTAYIGSVQNITWSHNLPSSSTSKIELSRNNGSTWTVLNSSVVNGNQNGSYNWTVTGPESAQARIRITANNVVATDTSDVNFSISNPPTVTITSPNQSSDLWTVGQQASVNWNSTNIAGSENMKIELSIDGGSTYPIVITSITPADGTESFTVQSSWVTTTAKVKVTLLSNPSISDVSNASFTIEDIVIPPTLTPLTFQASQAIFPNPERGFYSWTDEYYSDYSHVRDAGNTLTRPYFRLDAYRNAPLPQSKLDQITSAFQKARQAGIKIIPRFSYNFGPYPNSDPDATQQWIEYHLQQLQPILAANEDVISSMEAGFVGAWGEWHTSTNGLDTDPVAKAEILDAILDALPASRMVALRYPSDMQLLNGAAITSSEAYSGTDHARIGSHQDCFLASVEDWGTWGRGGNPIDFDKAYVAQNGQYSVVGGETCNPNPPRSDCPTALSELEYMHWSYLNEEYEPTVIQGFKDQGCFDEIKRRLGYRYELTDGSYTSNPAAGSAFELNLELTNNGFASMFNARPVFAVLDNGTQKFTFPLNTDPRWWQPGAIVNINEMFTLPQNMPTGNYTLALWLPDQAMSIRNNPLYAVQFANQNVWDAAAGYNILAQNIAITGNGTLPGTPSGTPASGTANVPIDGTFTWQATDADCYDLWFGLSSSQLQQVIDCTTVTSIPANPPLDYNTTYFWQVVAENSFGSTSSAVWSFQTEPAPSASGFPTVASTSTSTSGGLSHTVSLPSGITSGDLLVMAYYGSAYDPSFTTAASGWTKIKDLPITHAVGHLAIFYKIANGSEGNSVNVIVDTTEDSAHAVYRITNWHGSTAPAVSAGFADVSANPNPDNLVAPWGADDNLWIAVGVIDRYRWITTFPSEYDLSRVSVSTGTALGGGLAMAARELNSSSDNPANFVANASDRTVALTIVIRP